MDWITGMQRAIDYIEANLDGELDYDDIARQSCSSAYHFQRVFGILCGYTLGEYIRNRRLTLAGAELSGGGLRVIDAALKYGYDSPDSFGRAFRAFHGVTPSQARGGGVTLRSFSRLSVKILLEGGNTMNYRIEEKPEMILTGFRRHFDGVPYGELREKQEEHMFVTTRGGQWMLRGASNKPSIDYCVITDVGDDGYDFAIAATLDRWERDNINNPDVVGDEFAGRFENIVVPAHTYAVFETERSRCPIPSYQDIRRQIVSEWLPVSGYQLSDAPEITAIHWRPSKDREQRYVEIWLPVEKK